jgi:hypothetical protein
MVNVSQNPDTNQVTISFDMFVPAGLQLVQGTSPLDFDCTRTAAIVVPPAFGDGKPFEVDIPPGPVTLMVKRISDDFSVWADGVSVSITPKEANNSL